ncbi:MAG: glycosyltransferase family 9 protein [Verrucomicrobiia bacterium]
MKILLFKLRYIGDVLLTTPAIKLLRKTFPESKITIIVNKGTEDVIKYNPNINQILVVDKNNSLKNSLQIIKEIRNGKFSISIDFASGDRAAWLSLLGGVPIRVGLFSTEGFRRWINHHQVKWTPGKHTVELYRDIAIAGINKLNVKVQDCDMSTEMYLNTIDEANINNYLKSNSLENKKYISVHIGCRYKENKWHIENWINLINYFKLPVVFIGASDVKDDVNAVMNKISYKSVSAVDKFTILETAALIKNSVLFIGHDSGPMHIAAAFGVPVAAFFGPKSDPVGWRPWCSNYCIIPTSSTVSDAIQMIESLSFPINEHI